MLLFSCIELSNIVRPLKICHDIFKPSYLEKKLIFIRIKGAYLRGFFEKESFLVKRNFRHESMTGKLDFYKIKSR
jgi:hypothetical protein